MNLRVRLHRYPVTRGRYVTARLNVETKQLQEAINNTLLDTALAELYNNVRNNQQLTDTFTPGNCLFHYC